MQDWTTLRNDILEELGDPDGNTWTPAFIENAMNEAQLRYAELTNCLRDSAIITHKKNQQIYNFASDFLDLFSVEDTNGNPVVRTTSGYIDIKFGSGSRDATSTETPQYMYSDLAGKGRFEFYPRLNPSIEAPSLVLNGGTLVPRIYDTSAKVIRILGKRLYVLGTTTLKIYEITDDDFILSKSITHGETLNTYVDMQIRDSLGATKIFFSADTNKIVQVTEDGTVSDFATGLSNEVVFIFPFTKTLTKLMWVESDFTWNTSNSDSFSVTELSGAYPSVRPYGACIDPSASNQLYVALNTTGLAKINTTTYISSITSNTVDSCVSYDNGANERIYFFDATDNLIKYIDLSTDEVTETAVSVLVVASTFMISDGEENIFFGAHIGSTNVLDYRWVRLVDNASSGEFYYSSYGQQASSDNILHHRHFLMYKNKLISLDLTTAYIYLSAVDLGEFTYIDGAPFSQEEGIITDLTGNENTIVNLKGDEAGALNAITSSNAVAVSHYSRKPRKSQIEIPEAAIKEYTKYRAYQKRGTRTNLILAESHKRAFLTDYIDHENFKANSGYNNQQLGGTVY